MDCGLCTSWCFFFFFCSGYSALSRGTSDKTDNGPSWKWEFSEQRVILWETWKESEVGCAVVWKLEICFEFVSVCVVGVGVDRCGHCLDLDPSVCSLSLAVKGGREGNGATLPPMKFNE